MGSITDALKAKGATGSNIAECIGTLPSSGGGSGDPGYTVEKTNIVYFDGEVTTGGNGPVPLAQLSIEDIIEDTITVTFNGVDYVCEKKTSGSDVFYGDMDPASGPIFTTYPFTINFDTVAGWIIFTEEAGTYSLKISAERETVTTTTDFEKAVNSASGDGGIFAIAITYGAFGSRLLDKTFNEIRQAGIDGKLRILCQAYSEDDASKTEYEGIILSTYYDKVERAGYVYSIGCGRTGQSNTSAGAQFSVFRSGGEDDYPVLV